MMDDLTKRSDDELREMADLYKQHADHHEGAFQMWRKMLKKIQLERYGRAVMKFRESFVPVQIEPLEVGDELWVTPELLDPDDPDWNPFGEVVSVTRIYRTDDIAYDKFSYIHFHGLDKSISGSAKMEEALRARQVWLAQQGEAE